MERSAGEDLNRVLRRLRSLHREAGGGGEQAGHTLAGALTALLKWYPERRRHLSSAEVFQSACGSGRAMLVHAMLECESGVCMLASRWRAFEVSVLLCVGVPFGEESRDAYAAVWGRPHVCSGRVFV